MVETIGESREDSRSDTQVLKKKILDAAKGKTEEGRKIVNLLVAYSLHQVRSSTATIIVVIMATR